MTIKTLNLYLNPDFIKILLSLLAQMNPFYSLLPAPTSAQSFQNYASFINSGLLLLFNVYFFFNDLIKTKIFNR